MTTRAAAVELVAEYMSTHVGGKRAAVFRAIGASLTDGPAPVPLRLIRDRIIAGPTFVPISASKLDAITDRLIADGWLTVVSEADPRAQVPRVWDLGPTIVAHLPAAESVR